MQGPFGAENKTRHSPGFEVPSPQMLAVLAEGVQVLGTGFPQSSLQQDVLLFVRYLLEMHPNLMPEAQSDGEPLLCHPHLPA